MPYKKSYKKKTVVKSSNNVRTIARQEVKKVINKEVETKYVYNYSSPGGGLHGYIGVGASVATGAVQQDLTNGLARGDTDNEFIGDKIRPLYIKIKYNLETGLSADVFNTMRLIVVQTIGGGTPSINNILHSAGNNLTPLSPYDESYRHTYKVLHDETHVINGYSTFPTSDKCTKWGSIYIPQSKLRTVSVATSSASITANSIYFFAVSDSIAGANPEIGYWATLAFKDA